MSRYFFHKKNRPTPLYKIINNNRMKLFLDLLRYEDAVTNVCIYVGAVAYYHDLSAAATGRLLVAELDIRRAAHICKIMSNFIIIKFVKMLVSSDSSEIYHLVALTQAV